MAEKQTTFAFADLKTKKDRFRHFQDAATDRQRRARAKARDLKLSPIVDKTRRARGKNNPMYFARTYFPEIYYNPLTNDQRAMFRAIKHRLQFGGLQALAASRGDGKTSIAKTCALWSVAYGHLDYVVVLGPNRGHAKQILEDIKEMIEGSDLFAQDFPEISIPVRALEGRPQNARFQTVDGQRTRMIWSNEMIRLPTVAGSPSSAALVVTRGVESSIRGLVWLGTRPKLVLVDDLETTQSAASTAEINARRDVVNKDLLNLAGPGKSLSCVYLCTVIRKGCLADELTDRNRSPAWNGIRQRFLVREPDRTDLWDKYEEIRNAERIRDDLSTCRESHEFYRKHRKQMDAGAKVNNPHRFLDEKLPDGSRKELSALQHAMNIRIDRGVDAFESELQNNPPDHSAEESSGITVGAVCQKLNHLERGIVPSWSDKLTAGIDVGSRTLHWVVMAWRNPAISAVVDYGIEQVDRPLERLDTDATRKQMADAIYSALGEWASVMTDGGGFLQGSNRIPVDLVLVDSGWMPDAIYAFCAQRRAFLAAKGFGSLTGQTKYRPPTAKVAQGPSWHVSRPGNKTVTLINYDADHYKNEVHSGFMSTSGQPGSIELFGSDPVHHRNYGNQINAESWVRTFVQDKGFDARFIVNHRQNHYLDASVLARLAGSILNFRVLADKPDAPAARAKSNRVRERKKLSERKK